MKKKIVFSFFLSLIIIISILILNINKEKKYYKIYSYFDKDIIITIYNESKSKTDKIFEKIDDIYSLYDKLVDRKNKYDNIENLYTINHNFNKNESLEISNELFDLISYGLDIYINSNNYIDISKGNIDNLWNAFLTTKTNKPSDLDLILANQQNIEDIILENNTIKNNHININLDLIVKGYVNEIVINLLKNNDINNFTINDGENIILGNSKYKVGIENPDDNSILKVIEESNVSISTTNYLNNYTFIDGERYHSYISNKTLMPSNNVKSVTVITDDIKYSEYLSKTLFFMGLDEGKEWIKDKDYKKIYWYTLDNEIIEW